MSDFAYTWIAPAYRVGDIVDFLWNEHNPRQGRINYIDTHYFHTGDAWHSYAIRAVDYHQNRHVTEKDILRLVKPRGPVDAL